MAIPKITRQEEQVLLSTGLLDFPLSPLTLQETALLDRPSSPSDCLIPVCENLSLAPFTGSISPKPSLLSSVPAAPLDEPGSDELPSHKVPDAIAPKSLAQVDPHWESLSKVKEVTAPTIIEFKTYEKEELYPSTGKIVRTRVIYPVIMPKENDCISIPPLSEAKGQVNSLVPSPLAMKPEGEDGITSTVTTLRELPASDQMEPVPAELMRDVADSDGAVSPPHQTPTPPRQPSALRTPSISPLTRDFLDSPRKEISDLPRLAPAQSSSSPDVLPSSRASSCFSSGEGTEREEGQFDDAEESDVGDSQQLHPCEQPLPPSPSPSPTPSPVPRRVNQLVQRILETRHSISDDQAVSPDIVAVVPDCPETSLCPDEQDADDVTPMDTSVQGEAPSVLPN